MQLPLDVRAVHVRCGIADNTDAPWPLVITRYETARDFICMNVRTCEDGVRAVSFPLSLCAGAQPRLFRVRRSDVIGREYRSDYESFNSYLLPHLVRVDGFGTPVTKLAAAPKVRGSAPKALMRS